ncbi:MAG: hypothetical protein IKU51_01895 [Clostridia bacterium]|nr:hypothetical protein [Clostridia bacterium]
MGKKKEKITYVDDGRTLADMSGVNAGMSKYFRSEGMSFSTGKEKWSTFWMAFRMMLLPTLAVCGGIALLYGLMYLLFKIL